MNMKADEIVKELRKYCHAWLDGDPYDIPKLAWEAADLTKSSKLNSKMQKWTVKANDRMQVL